MRWASSPALLAASLLATSCSSGTRHAAPAGPAPNFEPVELVGPLPGDRVEGRYRDENGRAVSKVHRLLVAREDGRRVALLLGRRHGAPCVGASPAEARSAKLDCFESWENPPLVVRVVVGGETRRRTDWLAVVGLTRAPTARVLLDSQSGSDVPLTVRSWPNFGWRAFAAITDRGDLGNMLSAQDRNGDPVIRVELSWSYDSPCLRKNEERCESLPAGPWSAAQDPVQDASGADDSDQALVFADPAIRRLAAGHTFFVNPTAAWDRCDGGRLGSVISLRFWPPVKFKGEIPVHEYAKDGEDVAYREGRAFVEAEQVTSVEAWVDHRRHHLVGINLEAFDETTEALQENPVVKITKFDMVEEPQPAGGPDNAEACPQGD